MKPFGCDARDLQVYSCGTRLPRTLTSAGKNLIRLCNALKIMVDLSHRNDAGFRYIAAIPDAPRVASHSNAFAICPHSRNATGRQLAAIRDRGGLVGLNFGVRFLHPEGIRDPEKGLAPSGPPPWRRRSDPGCKMPAGFPG